MLHTPPSYATYISHLPPVSTQRISFVHIVIIVIIIVWWGQTGVGWIMGVVLREGGGRCCSYLFSREMVREAVHRLSPSLAAFGVEVES